MVTALTLLCIGSVGALNSTTNLSVDDRGIHFINWTWDDPVTDYNHTDVYLDGEYMINTTNETYNATNLRMSSNHTISLKAIGSASNESDWTNSSAMTKYDYSIADLKWILFGVFFLGMTIVVAKVVKYEDSDIFYYVIMLLVIMMILVFMTKYRELIT